MNELVAVDLAGGPAFVDALVRAWDDGDAVLPVDQRLPAPSKAALLDSLRPGVVVGPGTRQRRFGAVPILPGDALVVATSGTTGTPKGVVLTHDALLASSTATSARLDVDPARDRWLACLPLAHIGGLSVVVRALHTGTALSVHPGFDAAAVDAAATGTAERATLVSLVPTALTRIDASRWRMVVVGGSAMPSDLPANAVRTYGLTETGSGVVYDGMPLADVEMRIADGEIHLRCPMLLRAYRTDEPVGTDPKQPDGWFATGDAGTTGVDGALTVVGRIGDVIVSGGEKVWPEPIERILATSPAIRDVAVGGRPDAEWGTLVVAYAVPADPAAPPNLDALRELVKRELPAYCAPRQLVLVDRIPRTAIGKVHRAALPVDR